MTQASATTNGVDVEKLVATVGALKDSPSLADFTFRAQTKWAGGGQSRTAIKGFFGPGAEDTSRHEPFVLLGDEPPVLLGQNAAPNAVESLLQAIGSCLAVGFAYNAAAKGITLESLEFDLEGHIDLQGFLGLRDDVRAGYDRISVTYRVKSDATAEQLDELSAYVQRTSPLLDAVRNPVEVTVNRAD